MTYFIRLKSNNTLKNLIEPYLERPTGSLLKSGIEEKFIDLSYQAGSWEKPRRVVCRIAWHENELFPPDRIRCDQLPYFSRECNQGLQSQGRGRKQDQGGQECFALGQNKLPSL